MVEGRLVATILEAIIESLEPSVPIFVTLSRTQLANDLSSAQILSAPPSLRTIRLNLDDVLSVSLDS